MTETIPVKMRALAELHPNPRNARTHSKRQIRLIADSIKAFGFNNPVLLDGSNMILAGHGRYEAAKLLGLTCAPTLALTHLSEAQKRAYVLADNKLAEQAGWDRAALALELGELAILLPTLELDWSIETTGFAAGEIEVLGHDAAEAPRTPEEALPALSATDPVVTRAGDVWQLGPHRVRCADARSLPDIEALMAGERAAMVFTDPPYNVAIDGHVSRTKRHREFAMASGEMSRAEFSRFLEQSLGTAVAVSRPGAIHAVCMDWRHIGDLLAVGETAYAELLNLCVWNKGVAGQGSLYRSQHELVAIFTVGGKPHRNTIALGRYGRNRSNVWTYAVARAGEDREGAAHPTPKPVALVADVIRDCTLRGERVLDPFLGSGTTLIAAEKVGRVCYGTELDDAFVDLIVRRWQAYTGRDAILLGTTDTFTEVAERRGIAPPT